MVWNWVSAPSLSGGASLHADNQGHCKGYCVKKTFQLAIEGKNRDRVLDAAKHEIRKYVKRERQKPLPEGADLWDFDWRLGGSKETVADLAYAEVMTQIDALAKDGAASFYIEVVAKPGQRKARADVASTEDGAAT